MEDHRAEFRRCMDELDVAQARKLWARVFGHLPQPRTDHDVLIMLHRARTESPLVHNTKRYYSHRWLLDHGLPSGLPDPLRPLAERLYPRIVTAVGISLNTSSSWLKPALPLVRGAMERSVMETMGDGVTDPVVIKRRMFEAKDKEQTKLFGVTRPS